MTPTPEDYEAAARKLARELDEAKCPHTSVPRLRLAPKAIRASQCEECITALIAAALAEAVRMERDRLRLLATEEFEKPVRPELAEGWKWGMTWMIIQLTEVPNHVHSELCWTHPLTGKPSTRPRCFTSAPDGLGIESCKHETTAIERFRRTPPETKERG